MASETNRERALRLARKAGFHKGYENSEHGRSILWATEFDIERLVRLSSAKGMREAAVICGTLAERPYDSAEQFEAASGCEAAILARAAELAVEPPTDVPLDVHVLLEELAALRTENATFRAAQKACEHCDAITMEEVKALRQRIAELEKERENFHVDYRMKCDVQTKAAYVRIEELESVVLADQEHIALLERQLAEAKPKWRCSGCGNEIDPDCCGCGDSKESHSGWDGHPFVPMGCDCMRATRP